MRRHEQVVTAETTANPVAVRAHRQRILVLDQHRVHLRAVAQFTAVAGQHTADPAHVEHAD